MLTPCLGLLRSHLRLVRPRVSLFRSRLSLFQSDFNVSCAERPSITAGSTRAPAAFRGSPSGRRRNFRSRRLPLVDLLSWVNNCRACRSVCELCDVFISGEPPLRACRAYGIEGRHERFSPFPHQKCDCQGGGDAGSGFRNRRDFLARGAFLRQYAPEFNRRRKRVAVINCEGDCPRVVPGVRNQMATGEGTGTDQRSVRIYCHCAWQRTFAGSPL
jgi:hypothetical protein